MANSDLGQPPAADFSLFWEVWAKLQEKFAGKENLDFQEMVYGAISGMVDSLKDPYTVFLAPDESRKFIEDIKGSFEGIGAEIGKKKGQIVVISPLEGTPAKKAGLRPGDKILKIDGKATTEMTLDEAVSLIRGEKEKEVILTILRDDWESPKEIKIIREVIEVPSLKWELKENNIAYIRFYQFSEKAGWDFRKIAYEILNTPAKKIIIDLRGNPGGYLEIANEIAGWFLKRDSLVVTENFSEQKESKEYRTTGNGVFSEFPIIIIMNQGSASASEILAGALRDDRGVKLIGEKSFGKGSVQELEKLKDDSSLKITVAKWLTPKGNLINDKGLEPDIKVEMSEEDYRNNKDPQLDKALEIIKKIE